MGAKITADPASYARALQGNAVQSALKNRQLPADFLALCVESGVVDVNEESLLFELEKSVGRRLKPAKEPSTNLTKGGVSSTKGMPVVSASGGTLPLERGLSTSSMYSQTVKETDARMAASNVLRNKDFTSSIVHNARKDWCTPELMKALLMDDSYADKLRAAAYPALVSYCERIFVRGGKTYVVPYITVLDRFYADGKWVPRKNDEKNKYNGRTEISTTFYLNNRGGIGAMTSSRIHVYDVSDFSSKEAVGRYMRELEGLFKESIARVPRSNKKRIEEREWKPVKEFLEPYATGKKPIKSPKDVMLDFMRVHKSALGEDTENEFVAIKTGETCYATIRNYRKEIRMDGEGWEAVVDVTNCMSGSVFRKSMMAGEYERQSPGSASRIRSIADESLRRLGRKVLSEEGLEKRGSMYVDTRGEEEYLERDYHI